MMMRKDTRLSVRCPVTYALEDAACQGTTFNLSRGAVSLQIMAPGQSTAICVELGKVRWATRRKFGVEFMVVFEDSKQRSNHFLNDVAKQNAV
jgi:hypothetical protein